MKKYINTLLVAVFIIMMFCILTACNDSNIKDIDVLNRFLRESDKYESFKINIRHEYKEESLVNEYENIFVRDKGGYISIPNGNNVYYEMNEDGYFYSYVSTQNGYIREEIDEEEIDRVNDGLYASLSEQLRLLKSATYEYSTVRHGFVNKSINDKNLSNKDVDIVIAMADKYSASIAMTVKYDYMTEYVSIEINKAELNFPEFTEE